MLNRETGTFKKSYGEDLALYRSPLPKITIGFILLLVFVVVPIIGTEYWMGVLNLIGIASLGALGLNILVGYSGQISVGHAAFMSVGAYTAAVLLREFPDLHWIIAMLGGGTMAALVGVLFGIPSLRIKGLYLAVATLAAQLIIEWVINHWTWLSGGAQGSIYVAKPTVPALQDGAWVTYQLSTNTDYYFLMPSLQKKKLSSAWIAECGQAAQPLNYGLEM
ncbi:MAG: branched-chain amino acid ABC transporter permease, partial [Pseudomonadota bacterium]